MINRNLPDNGISLEKPVMELISGRLLTVREVAQFLNINPETVRVMARQGSLPAQKVGKVWRFDQQELCFWLKSNNRTAEKNN